MQDVAKKNERILELIEYIYSQSPDANSLLQFVTLRTFSEIGAANLFISELKSGGVVIPIHQFGFTKEQIESWTVNTLDDHIPTADALKSNNFVWLADNEDWIHDYPDLIKYKNPSLHTFIAWPIHIRGAYMSVLGSSFREPIPQNHELRNFLEIIGGLIGMHLSGQKQSSSPMENPANSWNLLTNRQEVVIELMSDGMTNNQIATKLGYSLSTIRQETIKIYELLGVTGRKGAIQAYRINFPIFGGTIKRDSVNF